MTTIAAVLADLRWLLLSPPLLNESAAGDFSAPNARAVIQRFTPHESAAIEAWIDSLAHSPTTIQLVALQELVAANDRLRLGRYAERLLAFYLRLGPLHRLVASNLALRHARVTDDRTTRGEIDFLLTDPDGGCWHWELAVKFFLCVDQPGSNSGRPGVDDFVGPDRADTLRSKLEKLFARQLPLTPDQPFDTHSWQPAAFAKAWIFYRYGQPIPECASFNREHCKGWWVPRDAISDLAPGAYWIAPRARWLCPAVIERSGPHAGQILPNLAEVQQRFDQLRSQASRPIDASAQFAQLLIQLKADDAGWREVSRGFVTQSV